MIAPFPHADPDHQYPRVTSARVLSALLNVAMGVRLLCPDAMLDSTAGYRLLRAHVLGDAPLGLVLLALGAVMTASLYTDRGGRLPGLATFASMLTWLLVAVDLAIANPSQMGTVGYGVLAAMNGYALAHLLGWRDQLQRGRAMLAGTDGSSE